MATRSGTQMTAATLIPSDAGLDVVREIARGCQACDLYLKGTQTVFGEGLLRSDIMLVGEQPGNDEDLAGQPFIGPAGRVLDRALAEAGIDRRTTYVTNVVKHFKWEPRGKRRIHAKPNAAEVKACMPWLQSEIRLVQPKVLVCLGATAAQALMGRNFRVTEHHGEIVPSALGPALMGTLHPSAILRAPDEAAREDGFLRLTEDLRQVPAWLTAR